jgi:hypothetical protein
MSSDRTESESLKNRADALRGLATSGVLVEARSQMRTMSRAGATPMTPDSQERLGQLTPTATTRVEATSAPTARGLEVQKPGTQVELPRSGFGQGAEKTVQPRTQEARTEQTQTPSTLEARSDKQSLEDAARSLRQHKAQNQEIGSGPTSSRNTSRTGQDKTEGPTR